MDISKFNLLDLVLKKTETRKNIKKNNGIKIDADDYIPEDTVKCPKCEKILYKKEVIKKKYICYECGHYFRVSTNNRIRMVVDQGSFERWFDEIRDANPLNFEGYEDKIKSAREKTNLSEAVTVGKCRIYEEEAVIGVCDSRFLMGSMGSVVGENDFVGGIAGVNNATIVSTYNTGNISSNSKDEKNLGGICGQNLSESGKGIYKISR